MTNYFKTVYDNLADIIKADYSRFKNKDRLQIKDTARKFDFGYEDFIILTPITDEISQERTTSREDIFSLELKYYKKYHPHIDYDDLTDFAENLFSIFLENRNSVGYWHYLRINSITYSIELPEDITNWYGFVIEIQIFAERF